MEYKKAKLTTDWNLVAYYEKSLPFFLERKALTSTKNTYILFIDVYNFDKKWNYLKIGMAKSI